MDYVEVGKNGKRYRAGCDDHFLPERGALSRRFNGADEGTQEEEVERPGSARIDAGHRHTGSATAVEMESGEEEEKVSKCQRGRENGGGKRRRRHGGV